MLVKVEELESVTKEAAIAAADAQTAETLEAYLTEADPGFSWDRCPPVLISQGRQLEFLKMRAEDLIGANWPYLQGSPETVVADVTYREVTEYRGVALLKLLCQLGLVTTEAE